jgi:hypothetical protein
MTRLVLFALLGLAACDKPSPESCKKALMNIQQLLGNQSQSDEAALASEVRRCRGGSSKSSVECATKATSIADLKKCEFYKVPEQPAGGSGSAGSAAAGSGSAK